MPDGSSFLLSAIYSIAKYNFLNSFDPVIKTMNFAGRNTALDKIGVSKVK